MLALLLAALLPFHGTVVAPLSAGEAVVRGDAVTKTVPAQTRLYRIEPSLALASGTGVDALLDTSTRPWTLRQTIPAPAFVAGLPDPARAQPIDAGSELPRATLVDQDGRLVQLRDAFRGKVVLLSFIFTRCPDTDVCIAISSKYSQLQHVLDPAKFALVEISLDPPYDSPAVLRAYGKDYQRDPRVWTLLTGTGTTITRVLDAFGISSLQKDDDNYLHSDKLFVITPQGRVGYVVQTAQWDPRAVAAEARSIAGIASNPFERFKLSLIADVAAFCGGSQYAGIVVLEIGLFVLITVLVTAALWVVGRVLWSRRAT
jgi:protein SCO1